MPLKARGGLISADVHFLTLSVHFSPSLLPVSNHSLEIRAAYQNTRHCLRNWVSSRFQYVRVQYVHVRERERGKGVMATLWWNITKHNIAYKHNVTYLQSTASHLLA